MLIFSGFRHLLKGGKTTRWILSRSFSRLPVRLPHRSIVELKGTDGCGFLQGLVTADVIAPTQMVQYAAFLNTQGRVLYDVIVYHVGGERVWLECDSECVNDVIKYMRKYQLRAKVTLSHVTDVGVYATMATDQDVKQEHHEIIRVSDPRASSLGCRVLIGSSNEGVGVALREYHQHRMRQGVPEGAGELPPGQCLPFEVNLDILNGVSFTKGCYIGQELTSRTYHTGVMRKRLIPLTLKHSMIASNIPWGTKVVAESNSGRGLGKVIGHCGDSLLAILRLPNLKDSSGDLWVELQDGTTVEAVYLEPDWLKN